MFNWLRSVESNCSLFVSAIGHILISLSTDHRFYLFVPRMCSSKIIRDGNYTSILTSTEGIGVLYNRVPVKYYVTEYNLSFVFGGSLLPPIVHSLINYRPMYLHTKYCWTFKWSLGRSVTTLVVNVCNILDDC